MNKSNCVNWGKLTFGQSREYPYQFQKAPLLFGSFNQKRTMRTGYSMQAPRQYLGYILKEGGRANVPGNLVASWKEVVTRLDMLEATTSQLGNYARSRLAFFDLLLNVPSSFTTYKISTTTTTRQFTPDAMDCLEFLQSAIFIIKITIIFGLISVRIDQIRLD